MAPVLIILLLLLSCGNPGLKRVVDPVENRYSDVRRQGQSLIRSVAADIYCERVDSKKLHKLLSRRSCAPAGGGPAAHDIPPVEFYHFIVKNTWKTPVFVGRCYIRYGTGASPALKPEETGLWLPGRPGAHDMNALYSLRRLAGSATSIDEIDNARDTLESDLAFVPSGDSMLFLRAFDWVPAGIDTYEVVVEIRYDSALRVISFPMKERLYRINGPDFREPGKDISDR
jgi:hypothetical protein